jgi:hypothetical protein
MKFLPYLVYAQYAFTIIAVNWLIIEGMREINAQNSFKIELRVVEIKLIMLQ